MDADFNLRLVPRETQSTADEFLKLVSDPFRTQIQSQAFFASLGTSLGITALIALLFCFLRPYNTIVYAPRLRHADEKHAPPPLGKGPFAWVSPVLKTKEQMLAEKVGLDATVFIRFTRMCRNIFLVLTILGCAVLIPVNIVGGRRFSKGQRISNFMKMTPQYMTGQVYWALVACAWIIDIVVCFFLWWNYKKVTKLRREYFESLEYQTSLHARTLMVTGIPKPLTTDDGIVGIVDSVQKNNTTPHAAIARNVKELPDLIDEHEELVRTLEKALAKYLKNPDKLPAERPMCKPSKKDSSYQKGQKVDAIDYLTGRIQHLEGRIREVRGSVDQRNAMSYGFASYESIEDAHRVVYAARGKHPQGATIRLAPRPSDIIWNNLPLSKQARRARHITNNFWVALLTLAWIVPNALIAVFLSNLSNLGLIWDTFDDELHRHEKTWAVVQGVLAPAITSLFYVLLPAIFRRLSMNAGDLTKTSRDRHVVHKLYAFFIFNNLIVFSSFGAVWQFVAAVVGAKRNNQSLEKALRDGKFWDKMMTALCNVSPFWITWLLQRNLGAAVDLSQVVNLAKGSFARRFMSPTPRELIEWTAPPPFDYASYYNYFLFYSTVALCFATLQPLVLPVTAFYFVLDYYLKKYLVLYVFVTKTESGGQFWRVLYNRFLIGTFLSNCVIGMLVKAKGMNWMMIFALLPLPILLWLFKLYCKRTFDDQIHYYTKGEVNEEAVVSASNTKPRRSDRVAIRFGHPALYRPLMTPMVHAKAQHMLGQIYRGRLDDDATDFDDVSSMGGYSDVYSLQNMSQQSLPHQCKKARQEKKTKKKNKSSPFEFVNESELNFEHFKNRAEFREEFGGDGEMYGRPEDAMGTPPSGPIAPSGNPLPARKFSPLTLDDGGRRATSRDSDRTLRSERESSPHGGAAGGHTYPHGYHMTPTSTTRTYSPSPERGLLPAAAPMGRREIARSSTPGSGESSSPGEETLRGRRLV